MQRRINGEYRLRRTTYVTIGEPILTSKRHQHKDTPPIIRSITVRQVSWLSSHHLMLPSQSKDQWHSEHQTRRSQLRGQPQIKLKTLLLFPINSCLWQETLWRNYCSTLAHLKASRKVSVGMSILFCRFTRQTSGRPNPNLKLSYKCLETRHLYAKSERAFLQI